MSAEGESDRVERQAVFQPEFLEDLEYWVQTDRKMALRLIKMVREILRDPFEGIGKPEPLKYEFSGAWSRRLNKEHRIVYLVSDDRIDFLKARYHY
ncbi:Txe/YoeB family addiction module toxin [Microcoleus sp. B4-C5]|uniref:Txe/YoeB family addiction module toxin n=1 Tax=Microcoleus TaxID=44471 RepID=UPI00020D30B6|nr:addiction module toxin, Txe/YoeB family [Microcoleus vaginatus FGP-2]UNU20987.1 Txe/YoeB family addiction module toxin [Microcoleus vaginatus PCC 9802]UNU24236.1 Txe/YoeB family addiction module toxin [Microcoleus vaginatus HSN003]